MKSPIDPSKSLTSRLQPWINGVPLTTADWQALRADLQSHSSQAQALGVNLADLDLHLQARLDLLRKTHAEFKKFCQGTWGGQHYPLELLWHLWLPLAMQLASDRQRSCRPLIQGILGGQGTGKTTLTQALQMILRQLQFRTVCLSIDDLYKTYADRQALQRHDPRLIWRGPPGTHDVELAIQVLDQLREPLPGQEIEIPRFDKSAWSGAGDRTSPDHVADIDIVLFEGWFVGAQPIDSAQFEQAPEPICTERDRQFARDSNERLKAYLPVWQRLDQLMLLIPEDYRLSKIWRRDAEQRMKAAGQSGMSDHEIDQFVEYFWKALHPELFIQPLTCDRDRVNLVIEIDAQHLPRRIYRPTDLMP